MIIINEHNDNNMKNSLLLKFNNNLSHSFLDVSSGNVVPFFNDLLVRWTLQSKKGLPQLDIL